MRQPTPQAPSLLFPPAPRASASSPRVCTSTPTHAARSASFLALPLALPLAYAVPPASSLPHRWYYDPKTQWYYGGEPAPAWSQTPPLPASALFGTAPHTGGPVPLGHGPGTAPDPSGSGAAAAAPPGVFEKKTVTRAVVVPKHPASDIGGYQAPKTGRVGGGMGAGERGAVPAVPAVGPEGSGAWGTREAVAWHCVDWGHIEWRPSVAASASDIAPSAPSPHVSVVARARTRTRTRGQAPWPYLTRLSLWLPRTGIVLEEPSAGEKRKREEAAAVKAAGAKAAAGKGGKAATISKEEAEALARREAARQRVAQRTAAGFGYL